MMMLLIIVAVFAWKRKMRGIATFSRSSGTRQPGLVVVSCILHGAVQSSDTECRRSVRAGWL